MSILDAKPVFDELLTGYGFRLAVEQYRHESFGSAEIEYVRRGLRFRLTWDGRDGILSVAVAEVSGHDHASEWSDLELLVSGQHVSTDEARAPGRVQQLRALADRFLAGRRSSSNTQAHGADDTS